jgi:uncharacterized membrane protein
VRFCGFVSDILSCRALVFVFSCGICCWCLLCALFVVNCVFWCLLCFGFGLGWFWLLSEVCYKQVKRRRLVRELACSSTVKGYSRGG